MTPALLDPAAVPSVASAPRDVSPVAVALTAASCHTALGDTLTTATALLRGERGLHFLPARGLDGGDPVPLGLINDWQPEGGAAAATGGRPRWEAPLFNFLATVPDRPWGSPRFPIFITSSNFGIGELYAFFQDRDDSRRGYLLPQQLTAGICGRLGWGPNVTHFSHACVSSHLGLLYASRQVNAGLADEALVVSYDFLSPFVAAGFHALKILFNEMPAPYAERAFGAIGLGDGMAFAVVAPTRAGSNGSGGFTLEAQAGANEMYHFTGNHPDGLGMGQLAVEMRAAAEARGRRVWIKGHGTGTIEAGRLEARHMSEQFSGAPLVSWKGALGHTLGSCGLVELALACEFIRRGEAAGTVGSEGEACFSAEVATAPFSLNEYTGCVLNSYAFGGAHYAFLLGHD